MNKGDTDNYFFCLSNYIDYSYELFEKNARYISSISNQSFVERKDCEDVINILGEFLRKFKEEKNMFKANKVELNEILDSIRVFIELIELTLDKDESSIHDTKIIINNLIEMDEIEEKGLKSINDLFTRFLKIKKKLEEHLAFIQHANKVNYDCIKKIVTKYRNNFDDINLSDKKPKEFIKDSKVETDIKNLKNMLIQDYKALFIKGFE